MSFDITTSGFYAIICGVLAAVAPNYSSRMARAVAGILTGIVAANILPPLRTALGI